MNILEQPVLVLNRSWMAIDVTNVMTAICDMYRGSCTGIATDPLRALQWEDWKQLPITDGVPVLQSLHGPIRVPTVICKSSFERMLMKTPKFNRKGLGERDNWTCAYTGEYCPKDGTIDHVDPRGKGGANAWNNAVWARKDVNHKKGCRTPAQAGLKLLRKPFTPPQQPACRFIKVQHPDWALFLTR